MSNAEIAETILMQLAGGQCGTGNAAAARLKATVGAKEFLILPDGVSFQLMKNPARITHVSIRLTANDTYTVKFGRLRGLDYKDRSIHEGVHCDQLRSIFETNTELYLTIV